MDCDKKCDCCEKRTERTEEERRKLLNRLSRIEGQVRGLAGMIERDAYCADILTQSAAVAAAINAFNRDLLANHIRRCVVQDLQAGDEGVVDELVGLVQKLMK
jgi:DNA-binding FrmR family transcriptional regulator